MSTTQTPNYSGSCLCRGVAYEIRGELSAVDYCHCSQCRKTSGHFVAAASCRPDALRLIVNESLSWYESSPVADRGFCRVCGSSLLWRPTHGKHISVMAGTLDAPTGLKAIEHIYVADASDYYAICDGLPQHPGDADSRQ